MWTTHPAPPVQKRRSHVRKRKTRATRHADRTRTQELAYSNAGLACSDAELACSNAGLACHENAKTRVLGDGRTRAGLRRAGVRGQGVAGRSGRPASAPGRRTGARARRGRRWAGAGRASGRAPGHTPRRAIAPGTCSRYQAKSSPPLDCSVLARPRPAPATRHRGGPSIRALTGVVHHRRHAPDVRRASYPAPVGASDLRRPARAPGPPAPSHVAWSSGAEGAAQHAVLRDGVGRVAGVHRAPDQRHARPRVDLRGTAGAGSSVISRPSASTRSAVRCGRAVCPPGEVSATSTHVAGRR